MCLSMFLLSTTKILRCSSSTQWQPCSCWFVAPRLVASTSNRCLRQGEWLEWGGGFIGINKSTTNYHAFRVLLCTCIAFKREMELISSILQIPNNAPGRWPCLWTCTMVQVLGVHMFSRSRWSHHKSVAPPRSGRLTPGYASWATPTNVWWSISVSMISRCLYVILLRWSHGSPRVPQRSRFRDQIHPGAKTPSPWKELKDV
jgi:hypothetical protein